jgi:hypothetical protein
MKMPSEDERAESLKEFNKIKTERGFLTLCDCGHTFVDHSLMLLGPCYYGRDQEKNRDYIKNSGFKVGSSERGECSCPHFTMDEFGELVSEMRKKKNGL